MPTASSFPGVTLTSRAPCKLQLRQNPMILLLHFLVTLCAGRSRLLRGACRHSSIHRGAQLSNCCSSVHHGTPTDRPLLHGRCRLDYVQQQQQCLSARCFGVTWHHYRPCLEDIPESVHHGYLLRPGTAVTPQKVRGGREAGLQMYVYAR